MTIESLTTAYCLAQEEGDTEAMERYAKAIKALEGEQAAKFYRDRPEIMRRMKASESPLKVVHLLN